MAGDPYKELGVSKGANADEVKKAYRKLAKELHPDKNPGDKITEDKFKRVTAAFDILGDKDKRAKYDAGQIDNDGNEQYRGFGGSGGGRSGGSPFGQGGGFAGAGGPGGRGNFDGVDLDDLFGMFGGGGRQRGARDFTARGQDVKATLDISLEDAIAGATRRIQFSDGRTLDVTIPKGASEGQTIRLRGQGSPGRGAENGDALIELKIEAHPIYKRDGADLTMDLPVSVPDAVLGAKVRVPTPEGVVQMTIPAGSNSGKILRLKARGAFAQGRRGDLLARLMVTLPDEPDAALIQFADDWRAKRAYTPGR